MSILHSLSHLNVVRFAKLQFIFKLHVVSGTGLKLGKLPFLDIKLRFEDLYLAVLAFDFRLEKV